ncbi:MAG: tagaturonate epimerase family protein, partial [Armatimonadota bacterium]|nr:tagaturonate epimerase family protein [Armatimonadota bacterium]
MPVRAEFVRAMADVASALLQGEHPPGQLPEGLCWYPKSTQRMGDALFFAARDGAEEILVAAGSTTPLPEIPGHRVAAEGRQLAFFPRGHDTCAALRTLFPFTAPSALPRHQPSLGCGDRLGRATPGHLAALSGRGAGLVLAQQSVRELTLTRRTYHDVVDAATWYVFREGYQGGFGADGDHLKSLDEVRQMLNAGATFITLDLSLCLGEESRPGALPAPLTSQAGTHWTAEGVRLTVSHPDLAAFWRVYGGAFPFIEEAHTLCRSARGVGGYDLEVSVDETPETTRPVDHLLLAMELRRRGIVVASIAPRFPGEFQKAVDYAGSLEAFEQALVQHAAVARAFGHKLGVHSGSDKFTIFPLVGRHAGRWLHLKTAGTSWLEALRVVASVDPGLFRACWAQAAAGFARAKRYYHVRCELPDVADAMDRPDAQLPGLLNQDAPRQFLH